MLSKNHIAVIALIGSSMAIRTKREPLLTWAATLPATHPMNYPVPDFGVDHDITASLNHSEAWTPVKDEDDNWVVPAGDIEFKLLQTDVEREPLLAKNASPLLVHQNGDSAHPINYFVPDFGTDYEIAASLRNTGEQETRLKHKINFQNEPLPVDVDHPKNYFVPDFGIDEDIAGTAQAIRWAQNLKGKWTPPKDGYSTSWPTYPNNLAAVQLDSEVNMEREPLLAKNASPLLVHQNGDSKHPIDYFVPDFGIDHDIIGVKTSVEGAEKALQHKMKADWGQTKGDNRGYFVPDFGQDRDITASLKNLSDQEALHGTWDLPPKE